MEKKRSLKKDRIGKGKIRYIWEWMDGAKLEKGRQGKDEVEVKNVKEGVGEKAWKKRWDLQKLEIANYVVAGYVDLNKLATVSLQQTLD